MIRPMYTLWCLLHVRITQPGLAQSCHYHFFCIRTKVLSNIIRLIDLEKLFSEIFSVVCVVALKKETTNAITLGGLVMNRFVYTKKIRYLVLKTVVVI